MGKAIRKIRAETINIRRKKWKLTHSIKNARAYAKDHGDKTVFRLPNGVYAIRK